MTRSKILPPIHKPAFDEESALRFAVQETTQVDGRGVHAPDSNKAAGPIARKAAKVDGAARLSITLMLKPETIARLKEEASRKEKAVDQIVEKLVAKHLGKH